MPEPFDSGLKPRLKIEIEWADIAQTKGDAYVVGHYIGVLPQNVERALDKALSGVQVAATPLRLRNSV